MTIQTVQLGVPRLQNEGLRIGAVRRPPRGVRKEEYAELDFFDVWLPILAPSQELLDQVKNTGMSFGTFSRRYRSEMKQTDAKQVIRLVAAMAEQGSLSIGCYCTEEWRCHRSILIELIQAAASGPIVEKSAYFDYCVYTIVHPDRLEAAYQQRGSITWPENRRWVTVSELLKTARKQGQQMAILFGDATDCNRLLYAGDLERVKIGDRQTEYTFSSLRPLDDGHKPQDLYLRSTGKRIAPVFIRPYAICHTPGFLPKPN